MNNQGGIITNPALGPSLQGLSGTDFLGKLIPNGIAIGFIIGVIFFVMYFLWGGIDWIMSGGDKQKLESSRDKITHAITGLIILFALYAILRVMERVLGINILELNIGELAI